jgi:hypothetical protein
MFPFPQPKGWSFSKFAFYFWLPSDVLIERVNKLTPYFSAETKRKKIKLGFSPEKHKYGIR